MYIEFIRNILDKIKHYAEYMIIKTEELQYEKKETERLLYQVSNQTVIIIHI